MPELHRSAFRLCAHLRPTEVVFFPCGLSCQPVADPGGGPGGAWHPPLFLDHTEARRAEKNFFDTRPPPLSSGSEGLDPPLPSTHIW